MDTRRTAWDVIQSEDELSILEEVIRANDLISAVDKTGIIVFAPTNDLLRSLVTSGVPTTSYYVKRVLLHHIMTVTSLDNRQLTTLNGVITNSGTGVA
jgi:hypothetical protein